MPYRFADTVNVGVALIGCGCLCPIRSAKSCELGGGAGFSIETTHDADYNLFTNVNVKSYGFWSATQSVIASDSWSFSFYLGGYQQHLLSSYNRYAWAVRSGDVAAAASTVPVPAAAWLFGSGLLGLVGLGRKRCA